VTGEGQAAALFAGTEFKRKRRQPARHFSPTRRKNRSRHPVAAPPKIIRSAAYRFDKTSSFDKSNGEAAVKV
jgi:hypothetical protein